MCFIFTISGTDSTLYNPYNLIKFKFMQNYNEMINQAPTVLVEFYASWCPHCQRMMPVVADVRELLGNSVPVYQFDIDKERELANEQSIESIPTFIIYHQGKEVWRHSGEIDGNLLLKNIQQYES